MNPKVLVTVLALVNLLAGVGVGVALDRCVLPAPKAAASNDAPPADGAKRERGHWKKGRRGGKDRMQRRMQRLTKDLGLDAEQVPRVQAVFEARRPKFMAVFAEVRPRLDALEKETHAELLAILRPEQKQKLEEMRKSFEGRRGPGGWGRGHRPPHGDERKKERGQ